ncbi:hypothetical protein Rsub_10003 [Raphidocelis subcapitata]|uniref:Uncharacterized protein n=1 Tax=Raphidocelis subcapitata TaxID=307507 RepID=A0A2V0PEC1_9CHLO|nr:hypothetical protein Rsub_10003 [Raphidocelis subcapitata]|eukprot:GBF97312.1 hypothetical protein Rsub_10003 [Raphidocelis subcapitata]
MDLKRLGFVRDYAGSALTVGEGVYRKLRAFVPAAVDGYVCQVEDVAAVAAAPIAALAQDKAEDLLAAVDGKVDAVLLRAESFHSKHLGSYATAKDAAYGAVEGAVNAARAALDPARYVAAAGRWAQAAIDALVAAADPDKALAAASAVYDTVASKPPVSRVLVMADPLITAGQTTYTQAHDMLVMQPLYKKIYDTAATLPSKAKDTTLYRRGYPLVAPVADPVLTNLSKSKVIKQIDDHLKPKAV